MSELKVPSRASRIREIPRHFELIGWSGHLAAIGLVALARLASSLFPTNPPAPYYLSIVLASLWGGRGPGLLAAVLAAVSTAYYDLGTGGRFDLTSADFVRLVIFFIIALITSRLVSSRRETEEELREVVDELRQLDRAKDEFVAAITHDLRSPLTSILGWAQLLKSQRDPSDDEARGALDSIIRSARVQSRLVDDLLEMSRVQLGKIEMRRETVDLVGLIQNLVDTFELEAESEQIDLHRRTDRESLEVVGDQDRIEQLLRNLISNAFKFTAKGGSIEVILTEVGGFAQITVSDTGEGIPVHLLPRVFDRYTQATTSRRGGLGLGLAIARHIADLHGGGIEARSDGEGRGATFIVEIPARPKP